MLIQTTTDPMTLHTSSGYRTTVVTQVSGNTVNEPAFSYAGALLTLDRFLGLPGVQFTVLPGAKPLAVTFTLTGAAGSSYQMFEILGNPPARMSALQPVFARSGEVALFTVIGQ